MRILITGASGFIGKHLVYALKEQGNEVIACVRNVSKFKRQYPMVQAMPCDFSQDSNSEAWINRLRHIDVVINAAGIFRETGSQKFKALNQDTPIALFEACQRMGVKKVIQISALGADETAFSAYHLSKKAADDYLATLDLDWFIVQPSIVYGPGAKSMSLFKSMAALPVTPLVNAGDQLIQPIYISDFVDGIINLLKRTDQIKKNVICRS